jgi:predicted house-cleaning noncanonical NTP pyrophosphatase (MazG superfamily)
MAIIKKVHNKLVRDKIPEYLKEQGIESEVEIVEDEVRYLRLLLDNLEEESQEPGLALEDEELLEKLAEIESTIDGVLKAKGWSRKELKDVQDEKDEKKGRFDKKVFLISTSEYVDEVEEGEEVVGDEEEVEEE